MQQLRLFFAMALLLYMFRVTILPIIRSTMPMRRINAIVASCWNYFTMAVILLFSFHISNVYILCILHSLRWPRGWPKHVFHFVYTLRSIHFCAFVGNIIVYIRIKQGSCITQQSVFTINLHITLSSHFIKHIRFRSILDMKTV